MEYNVLVEFDELSDDEAERVLTDMSGWHPSIGWCPHGRPRVTVTVDGLTVRGAGDWGLSEVERFVGRRARSVEVLPTADFDARAGV